MYGFIYITTNKINNKKYIGKRKHGIGDDTYLGSGTVLNHSIKKYGRENFEREILDYAIDNKELSEKEKYYIKQYNAIKNRNFYNIHEGGDGGNTIAGFTDEQKKTYCEKLSKIFSGEGNAMFGKKHSERTKHLQSLRRKEASMLPNSVYKSEEFKKTMSEATSGEKNGMYNHNHSEESKLKMSINSKGKTSQEKNGVCGKSGAEALNGKKIFQYEDGNFQFLIKEFPTVTCLLEFLEIKGHSALYRAIKNKSKYKGYYWNK